MKIHYCLWLTFWILNNTHNAPLLSRGLPQVTFDLPGTCWIQIKCRFVLLRLNKLNPSTRRQEVTAKSCDLQLSTEKSDSNISFLLPSSFGSVYFLCILLQISPFSSVESLEFLFFKNGLDKYCICKHFLWHFEGLFFGTMFRRIKILCLWVCFRNNYKSRCEYIYSTYYIYCLYPNFTVIFCQDTLKHEE